MKDVICQTLMIKMIKMVETELYKIEYFGKIGVFTSKNEDKYIYISPTGVSYSNGKHYDKFDSVETMLNNVSIDLECEWDFEEKDLY